MNPGAIVSCRNREWVLLSSDDNAIYRLRPLTGATDDVVAVHKGSAHFALAGRKRDPSFVVLPRDWEEESIVEETMPRFPEPLAAALRLEDADSVRYVLGVWHAGFLLRTGAREQAMSLLAEADSRGCKPAIRREVDTDLVSAAAGLDDAYPLTHDQAERIADSWVESMAAR